MKKIEKEIERFATDVLWDYRRRQGLTCYAHADNRERDIRYMKETMEKELPALLERLGVKEFLESLGEAS